MLRIFRCNRSIGMLYLKRNLTNNGSYSQYKGLIESYTLISDQHLTPEIKLRLITRNCLAWNQPVTQNSPHPLGEPFWAFYWPGGQALSRYILDNPLITKGKCVLDFGCGSGALSIAALISGAKSAIANDIDHIAIAASQLNAEMNGVKLKVNKNNLVGSDFTEYDVILVGDMLYDSEISKATMAWLWKLRTAKKTILIGDPGRGPIRESTISSSLRLVAKYELDSITREDNYGFHQAQVFILC